MDLLARSRRRLPLPPDQWSEESDRRLNNLAEVAALANLYQDMVQNPAWQHFHGRMESLRKRMEVGLRRGDRSPLGIDLSDTYRVAITLLENLMAYPDLVQSRLEMLERQTGITQGRPPAKSTHLKVDRLNVLL